MTDFDAAARLAQLRSASDRIASNLLELEGDATVAMLEAAELRGITAEQWRDARLMLAALFASHTELKDLIEQATRLSGRGWSQSADRQIELERLLVGPSLVVSDTSVRLSDRGLLSESRRVVRRTPDELIEEMIARYDDVKSFVIRVSAIWDELIPRLRTERQRSVALTGLAGELGLDSVDIEAAAGSLRDLSDVVLCDPLAADVGCLDAITSAFSRAEEELNELRDARNDWPDRLDAARDLLEQAERAVGECDEVVAHAASRIVLDPPIAPVVLPTDLVSLLDAAGARGDEDWQLRAGELVAWRRSVADCLADAKAVAERCEGLLVQRDELRARLEAYAAKAARLGLLEDEAVDGAYQRARAALYTAPTDLAAAERLVGDYGRLLATGAWT